MKALSQKKGLNMPTESQATTQSPVEIYKTANAQASFICEAMLNHRTDDGKVYNKVVLVIVKRDANHKALETVKYYIDLPSAKVIFDDIWRGELAAEYKEYKQSNATERALNITSTDDETYRVSVMNKGTQTSQRLFFDLTRFQARCLARQVLDYLHCHELATIVASELHAYSNQPNPQ
jgi:molybdopterin synthase catalytic subunit